MVRNLSNTYSIVSDWISELRDVELQADKMRFRRNLERIGELAALEISTKLAYTEKEIQTPLGTAVCKTLSEQPILATNNMITGVTHPTNGKKESMRIEIVNTDCHRVLRSASLIPRKTSLTNCAKLKGKSFPSIIASVRSLR